MSSEATIRLFSYGTLQLESVQLSSFGRVLQGSTDVMPGFRRSTITITDPDVIKASGANVHPIVARSDDPADEVPGTVFEITAAELRAADEYEVSDYERIEVRLKSGVDAWVYVRAG
jgi:hypothetical protein